MRRVALGKSKEYISFRSSTAKKIWVDRWGTQFQTVGKGDHEWGFAWIFWRFAWQLGWCKGGNILWKDHLGDEHLGKNQGRNEVQDMLGKKHIQGRIVKGWWRGDCSSECLGLLLSSWSWLLCTAGTFNSDFQKGLCLSIQSTFVCPLFCRRQLSFFLFF